MVKLKKFPSVNKFKQRLNSALQRFNKARRLPDTILCFSTVFSRTATYIVTVHHCSKNSRRCTAAFFITFLMPYIGL